MGEGERGFDGISNGEDLGYVDDNFRRKKMKQNIIRSSRKKIYYKKKNILLNSIVNDINIIVIV